MREVRCPRCNRLLAVEHDNGLVESRTGRQVIWTEQAVLLCLKCGREVPVGAGKKKFVDKKSKPR